MFTKILISLDGSKQVKNILPVAVSLAKAYQATLCVICVVDPAYFLEESNSKKENMVNEIDYPAAARESTIVEEFMEKIVTDLRKEKILVDGKIIGGEPEQSIPKAAKEMGCDMIIMGHRHLSWLGQLTETSICHSVIKNSFLPVLVVPQPDKG
ncbi:universal stress protein [Commensalibacter nepenthis]|uniref:Universal stress protein n=1 Tax=Commensalibacter nepenthis TaxID=3043872 RepID=A0ABT6QA82_9PROT|nr:universal stress protein [Commensalibacter sp. TBRC 10068]MDI2113814.1 universal stress protein [Commensalibacter sp. TBRC 10068]